LELLTSARTSGLNEVPALLPSAAKLLQQFKKLQTEGDEQKRRQLLEDKARINSNRLLKCFSRKDPDCIGGENIDTCRLSKFSSEKNCISHLVYDFLSRLERSSSSKWSRSDEKGEVVEDEEQSQWTSSSSCEEMENFRRRIKNVVESVLVRTRESELYLNQWRPMSRALMILCGKVLKDKTTIIAVLFVVVVGFLWSRGYASDCLTVS
jgi:hypothetical protein